MTPMQNGPFGDAKNQCVDGMQNPVIAQRVISAVANVNGLYKSLAWLQSDKQMLFVPVALSVGEQPG